MARTLFFIEAFLFAALAIVFPIIASETAAAFILPVAISLVLPFSCAVAIWPPRSVMRALGSAFSSRGPDPAAVESARILEELGSFSRAAAVLGLIFSLSAACRRIPFANGLETWTFLGIYLSAYALINAMLGRILAAVVARQVGPSALGAPRAEAGMGDSEHREAFASAYGLTPREWETAERIALGLSYKETAYELGISIKTVKVHMSSVYEKTGAASNVALALLIRGLGRSSTKVR